MMAESYSRFYLYKRIVQAKIFMDSLYDENIDLVDIAGEACFYKFHFIRLFKSIYGKTPHQYLVSVRMEKAKVLLQKEMPVAAVCNTVGFTSYSSFTALFKRYAGRNPSEYRQQHIRHNKEIKETPLQFVPACFARQNGWIV